MGVDLVAVYDRNKNIADESSLLNVLTSIDSWFGSRLGKWRVDADSVYIENESIAGYVAMGRSVVAVVPSIRWQMFCENVDQTYEKSIEHFINLGIAFR